MSRNEKAEKFLAGLGECMDGVGGGVPSHFSSSSQTKDDGLFKGGPQVSGSSSRLMVPQGNGR